MRKKLKVFDTKNRLEITVLPDWFFYVVAFLKVTAMAMELFIKNKF